MQKDFLFVHFQVLDKQLSHRAYEMPPFKGCPYEVFPTH